MTFLEFDRIGKIFGASWALRDVTTSIAAGELTCVLGANGMGKSTLLRLLSGAIRPTTGRLTLDGRKLRRNNITASRSLLFLRPDLPLVSATAEMHFATALRAFGLDKPGIENIVAKHLDSLGVRLGSGRLSRGERMKVWLATLFSVGPRLWVLDEPHQSGLDAQGMAVLEQQCEQHCRAGGAVVFSTQWPQHALSWNGRELRTRVLVLHEGRMVFHGEASQIAPQLTTKHPALQAVLEPLMPL